MGDGIIAAVAEAEARAAEIKQTAETQAETLVSEAEKYAIELGAASGAACAERTEEIVQQARRDADELYRKEIETVQKEARADAEARMDHLGAYVAAVVGRIVK